MEGEKKLLAFILVIGLVLRLTGSVLFPLWSGPDEPAHFFYLSYIGDRGELPAIPLTQETLRGVENESIHQPPLYYALMAPFYSVLKPFGLDAAMHFLRLFSVAFGTACIALVYLIAKRLGFGKGIPLASSAFVALLPTHVISSSVLGNSALSWLFCLAAVYYMARVLQEKKAIHMAIAGVLMAAIVLTKFTGLSVAIAFLVAGWVFLFEGKGSFSKRAAILLLPFSALPVFLRNIALTGGLFPSHLTVKIFSLERFSYFLIHLFPSIWLQEYGVATVPEFRFLFFGLYAVLSLAAFSGAVFLFAKSEWPQGNSFIVMSMLVLPVVLNFLGLAYINLEGMWPDGRLLLETIGLAAILFIAGQKAFMRLIGRGEKAKLLVWGTLLTMLFLDLVVLVNYNRVLPPVPWPLF